MKKKKLMLNDLEVESFITSSKNIQNKTPNIKGGGDWWFNEMYAWAGGDGWIWDKGNYPRPGMPVISGAKPPIALPVGGVGVGTSGFLSIGTIGAIGVITANKYESAHCPSQFVSCNLNGYGMWGKD